MKRLLFRRSLVRVLGLAACALLTSPAIGQQPGPPAAPGNVPTTTKLDVTKNRGIERKTIQAAQQFEQIQAALNSQKVAADKNPTVKPGEVKWHASFAAACDAATKSGKPVLLLHMMGQLDKQFC